MSNEAEREAFESNEKLRFGYDLDTLKPYDLQPDQYMLPLVQARWEGFRAGAAYQRTQAQSAPDMEALKAEILSLTVRLENSDAVIDCIQKIITRLNKGEPDA